jgi:hypothetical protein
MLETSVFQIDRVLECVDVDAALAAEGGDAGEPPEL